MPNNFTLEQVIEDSITDSELPPEPEATPDPEPVEEAEPEVLESTEDPAPEEDAPEETEEAKDDEPEVEATEDEPKEPEDDFDKRFGIPAKSSSGRENRIPHSRVKGMVTKAIAEATKKTESQYVPKIQEFETKVKDYEDRLSKVAKFEEVMEKDPKAFLETLSTVPAYKPFFAAVSDAFEKAQKVVESQAASPVVDSSEPVPDDMPQPNAKMADGTMSYDMDGLKALFSWHAKQVEDRVTKKHETRFEELKKSYERYEPIAKDYEAHQKIQEALPKIQAQIAEARTWTLFNEHEEEIITALQADRELSLEGAYRRIVVPKLTTNRDQIRQDVLREIKKAPKATSIATRPTKDVRPAPTGPRDLLEIVAEAAATLKQ